MLFTVHLFCRCRKQQNYVWPGTYSVKISESNQKVNLQFCRSWEVIRMWWMLLRSQIMFSSTDTYWHHEIELCCTAWPCFWVWNWQGLLSRHLQNMLEEHMMPPVVTSKITIHVILVKTWASTAGVQRSKSSRKVPKQPQKHGGLGVGLIQLHPKVSCELPWPKRQSSQHTIAGRQCWKHRSFEAWAHVQCKRKNESSDEMTRQNTFR